MAASSKAPAGAFTALVMAAGLGTRMRSGVPKVLHPVCGRPLVAWPVLAAQRAGAERVVVIRSPEHDLAAGLPDGTEQVAQPRPDGTGGAVRAALDAVREAQVVLVLSGDSPLFDAEAIAAMVTAHRESGAAMTLATAELEEPGSYGRVVRDAGGDVERIAEVKAEGDATAEELAIREVNGGVYAFEAAPLAEALEEITNQNAQGEYYLPDVLGVLRGRGLGVLAWRAPDEGVTLGVNDRVDLALVEGEARARILRGHMLGGVTIVDPDSTWIDAAVELEPDVRIEPATYLRGATSAAQGAVIGPHATLEDCAVGAGAAVVSSHCVEAEIGAGASVGPFAYLRPGTRLGERSKAGTFVEVKGSSLGEEAKVPHLSYVGDAEIGARANLGAGTITANYDGFAKHRTSVGSEARLGIQTSLVAPVSVGARAYTAAGSVITEDVPEGALGVARADQRNVEGYAERRARRARED